jgi:hypothetical protein
VAIWQLDPIDPTDHTWRASTYSRRVIVRAPTEEKARHIAFLAFRIAAQSIPGTEVPLTPWDYEYLVECQKIEAGPYQEEGAEAILEPAEYDHEWKR